MKYERCICMSVECTMDQYLPTPVDLDGPPEQGWLQEGAASTLWGIP